MKSKKGMSLIIFTIIIVLILIVGIVSIVVITKEKDNGSISSNYETEQNSNIENTKTKFWVDNYKSWGEQKESYPETTLFGGKFTAPIDLASVNSFAKKIVYKPNGWYAGSVTDINEILNLETNIKKGRTPVVCYYGKLNEYGNYNSLLEIELENFNETEISMKECFNNKWWSITELYSPQSALGIYTDDEEYNPNWDTIPLQEELIEVLGGPTHVFIYQKTDGEYKSINYGMYYEYSDFSIEIDILEMDTGNNYACKINRVTYAPKEYWEKEIEELKRVYKDFEILK